MKRIIMFVLLFAALKVAGQTTGYLRFDTVKVMKQNGTCELYVINKTKDSLGLLTNVGGGLTQFKRSRRLSDSTFTVGNDTITILGRPGGGGGPDSLRQHKDSVNMYLGGTPTFQYKNKNTDTVDWYNAIDFDIIGDGVTDNTSALQSLINLLGARKRNAKIYFPDSVYIFSGNYQDTTRINAQIIFPSVHIDSVQYTITLVGSRRPPFSPSAYEATPAPAGTKFRSTRSGNTQLRAAFFGGRGPVGGANDEVSYMVPGFEDITIQMPTNPSATALYFNYFTNLWTSEVNIIAGNSQSVLDKPEPTDSTSYGLVQPHSGSGTDQRVRGYVSVLGFYNGIRVGENANIEYAGIYACKNAFVFDQSSGTSLIQKAAVGWCPYTFYFRTAFTAGTTVDVREYSVERWTDAAWYTFVADVKDPNNNGRGDISYYTNNAGVGTINSRQFTKVGGDSLHTRHIGSTDTYLDMRGSDNVRLSNGTTVPGYVQPTLYPYGTPTANIANSFYLIPKGTGDGTLMAGFGIFGTDFVQDGTNFIYSHLDAKATSFDQIITNNGSVALRPYRIVVGSNDPFTFGTDGSLSMSGYTTKSTLRVGSIFHQSYSVNNNWIGDNLDYDNTNFVYKANGYGVLWRNITGGMQIETAPSGTAGAAATMTRRFHLANTGAITFGAGSNSYTFPTTRASAGQVLTDVAGDGDLDWATPSSGITSINSQTGPAITVSGQGAIVISNPSANNIGIAVDVTSDLLPRTIDAVILTAQNTGTSETDLFTKTIAGSTLNTDKQTLNFEVDGEFNDNTATAQLKLYFGGNVTLNTGAINISTAFTAWRLRGYIIRTSSSTAHVTYELHCPGLATPLFIGYTNLTSLNLATSNIFKITAQAGGAGGGTGDITAHSWQVLYKPGP